MGTRLIVKNLPKHAKDKDVLALFSECGDITDCKVAKTKCVHAYECDVHTRVLYTLNDACSHIVNLRDGRSRQFAFVGYRQPEQAAAALKHFDKSFMGAARLKVEVREGLCAQNQSTHNLAQMAKQVGSEALQRPWSKHSPGSSQHTAANKQQQQPAPSRKRARQETVDDVIAANPRLQEFMSVMQPRSKKQLWGNDDTTLIQVLQLVEQ